MLFGVGAAIDLAGFRVFNDADFLQAIHRLLPGLSFHIKTVIDQLTKIQKGVFYSKKSKICYFIKFLVVKIILGSFQRGVHQGWIS